MIINTLGGAKAEPNIISRHSCEENTESLRGQMREDETNREGISRVHTFLMDVFGTLFQFKVISYLFWQPTCCFVEEQQNARQSKLRCLLIVHGTLRIIQAVTAPFYSVREMQFYSQPRRVFG